MNRSTSLVKIGIFAALTVFTLSAYGQNLLVNGNFATGSLAPWVPFTTPNGTNGAGLPDVILFSGGTYSAHFDVGEVIADQSPQGGGISQIVMASTAGAYNFSANFASKCNPDGFSNADAGTFSIVIDGATLATKALGGCGPHQVLRGTFAGSVDLTAGSHTFEVLITRVYTSFATDTPNQGVTNLSLSLATNRVHGGMHF